MELDNTEVDLDTLDLLPYGRIKSALQCRGLSTTGNKRVLMNRLRSYLEFQEKNVVEVGSAVNTGNTKSAFQSSDITNIRRKEKCLKLNISHLTEDLAELLGLEGQVVEIENSLVELEKQREKYVELNDRMMSLLEEEEVNAECESFAEYQRKIRKLCNQAQKYIADSRSVSAAASLASTEKQHKEIKLPKFDLPAFSGDTLKVNAYWDQFKCAVHDNNDLSAVQKLSYLRASLKGAALQTIDGFEITAANYKPAVDVIIHRFGRKKIIVAHLVKSIVKFELKDKVQATSLRYLHDTLQNRIRALEGLGFKPEDNQDVQMILIPLLEMKLPQSLAEKWELQISDIDDEEVTIDLFFKFLNRQVVSKEAGERSQAESKQSSNTFSKGLYNTKPILFHKKDQRVSSVSALLGAVKDETLSNCHFCKKSGHESKNCHSVNKKSMEERWKVAKDNKLCFNCLKPSNAGHNSRNCRQPSCTAEGCGKKHHRLLHADSQKSQSTSLSGCIVDSQKTSQALLQTALATLVIGSQELPVRILLDTGSQRSYIRKNIVESFDQRGPTEVLSISTLGGNTTQYKKMQRVKCSIRKLDCALNDACIEIEALAIDKICAPLQSVSLDLSKYPHLKGLAFTDNYQRGTEQVDILIGVDFYYSIIEGTIRKGASSNTPLAVESKLGWILCGQIEIQREGITTAMFSTVKEDISKTLKSFWELESIGILKEESLPMKDDEIDALKQFKEGLSFDGERYQVSIPWKREHLKLKNNYNQAVSRLRSVENRLQRDHTKAEDYTKAISQYVKEGFVEEITADDNNTKYEIIRYLPHHAVYREEKSTTKTRIVFDASAHEGDEPSLNDCTLQGPALQPNLTSVLIRFRMHRVALVADIKKMFLQIKIADKDRDSHRYIWRDMQTNELPKIYRMKRVTFGVSCSPFLAIATVQSHAEKLKAQFPIAAVEVIDNMYVDDCLTGAENVEKTIELKDSLFSMMKSGGFHLTKWASNSKEVLGQIHPAERAPSLTVEFDEREALKALGMSWGTQRDCFYFDCAEKIFEGKDTETKRSQLSIASKIFDPMGFLSPYVLRAKVLFQELWTRGMQWDDRLPVDIRSQWKRWKEDAKYISDIKVPRCFVVDQINIKSIELHGFGDASPKAYGAAMYLRITDVKGKISTSLVMSKSRVAPLKIVTLPRLELLAAVVNTRLIRFIHDSLKRDISRVVLWSDSTVALHWLKTPPSNLKSYVANRVSEIQSTWNPEQWRHCPGNDNPADFLTRGMGSKDLIGNEKWFKGPLWLNQPSTEWPKVKDTMLNNDDIQQELKNTAQLLPVIESDTVIDPKRYSSWRKLVEITATVFRAMQRFKGLLQAKLGKSQTRDELSSKEIRDAEYFWYRKVQSDVYEEEIKSLSEQKEIKKSSKILKLDPFYDNKDSVIRVGGRLQYSDLPEETKHQVILPHGHPLVEMKVQQIHTDSVCVGPLTTLAILRQTIWLTQGHREVKRIIKNCLRCKRQNTIAASQKMGNLPKERIQHSPAFTHVGVDFAGPLYVRTKSTSKKVYICIFTCAASRMVHLELVTSLHTDEFLQAFRRMINRRGLCQSIQSDNAKTFKAVYRILQQLFASSISKLKMKNVDQNRVSKELAVMGIQWKFIVERAPWRGGFWERVVKSVKEPLHRVLGNALLSYIELYTILTDVEAIVNSRPLTIIGDDINDAEPITPAHLAIGRSLKGLPEAKIPYSEEQPIIKRFLYQQRILNHFWKRWHSEYLHQLSPRNKWKQESSPMAVGDIVLISEERVPRGNWLMGRIIAVHPGNDGLIRTVTLKTKKGQLRRPIQRIHNLEIQEKVHPSASHQLATNRETYQGQELERKAESENSLKQSIDHLPKEDQAGEDVQFCTRSGRVVIPTQRLGVIPTRKKRLSKQLISKGT